MTLKEPDIRGSQRIASVHDAASSQSWHFHCTSFSSNTTVPISLAIFFAICLASDSADSDQTSKIYIHKQKATFMISHKSRRFYAIILIYLLLKCLCVCIIPTKKEGTCEKSQAPSVCWIFANAILMSESFISLWFIQTTFFRKYPVGVNPAYAGQLR